MLAHNSHGRGNASITIKFLKAYAQAHSLFKNIIVRTSFQLCSRTSALKTWTRRWRLDCARRHPLDMASRTIGATDVDRICATTKKKIFSEDAAEGAIFKKFYSAFDKDAKALLDSTLYNYVNILARSFNRRISYTEKLRVRAHHACTLCHSLNKSAPWLY